MADASGTKAADGARKSCGFASHAYAVRAKGEGAVPEAELDGMLAACLSDLLALGHSPVSRVMPHVRVTDNRRRLGSCSMVLDKRTGRFSDITISVSRRMLARERDAWSTLYHECIHAMPGCQDHGREFKQIADEVGREYGISVTTTYRGDVEGVGYDARSRKKPSELDGLVEACVGMEIEMDGRRVTVEGVEKGRRRFRMRCSQRVIGRGGRTGTRYMFVDPTSVERQLEEARRGRGARHEDALGRSAKRKESVSPQEGDNGAGTKTITDVDIMSCVGKVVTVGRRRFRIDGIEKSRPSYRVRAVELGTGSVAFLRREAIRHLVM